MRSLCELLCLSVQIGNYWELRLENQFKINSGTDYNVLKINSGIDYNAAVNRREVLDWSFKSVICTYFRRDLRQNRNTTLQGE